MKITLPVTFSHTITQNAIDTFVPNAFIKPQTTSGKRSLLCVTVGGEKEHWVN